MASVALWCRQRMAVAAASWRVRSGAGFSLLEVLVTVTLLSLIYAIALPSIGRTRVKAAVFNSTQAIIGTISLAKASAVRFGRPSVLRLDSNRDLLWVEVDTTLAGTGVADTLGFLDLGEDWRVDLEANRGALCFDGRGIGTTSTVCTQAGAVIVVSLAQNADTLFVSALGRVITR